MDYGFWEWAMGDKGIEEEATFNRERSSSNFGHVLLSVLFCGLFHSKC